METFNSLSAWWAAAGASTRDTAYGANFADISTLALDDGTDLSFGAPVNIRTIGNGWSTWSGGYTGQVLYTNGATSIAIGLLDAVGGLGLFVESNPFGAFTFTLTTSDGSTVSGTYEGDSGAGFLGFVGEGITGVTLTSSVDFAFGDFHVSPAGVVPEPAAWALMIGGVGAVGGAMRHRRSVRVAFATA